jgi:hypothetical protein
MTVERAGGSNGLLLGLLIGAGGVSVLAGVAFVGLLVIGLHAAGTPGPNPSVPTSGDAQGLKQFVQPPPPVIPFDPRLYETPVIYDHVPPAPSGANPFNYSGLNP